MDYVRTEEEVKNNTHQTEDSHAIGQAYSDTEARGIALIVEQIKASGQDTQMTHWTNHSDYTRGW